MPRGQGWTALTPAEQSWAAPSWRPDEQVRQIVELPLQTQLTETRGHLWRYPAGAKGRAHHHTHQEEVFVVLQGTVTLELGEERELVDLPPQSVVVLSPGTRVHVSNRSDADVVVFIYGAPPVAGDGVIVEG
mgnify:CR=1 FL=1